MPEVSIIIPVYNTVQYLTSCIDSVLDQSYHDFELIIIDDGSTDGSANICDNKAVVDSRIKCFHQNNQGQQCAIQHGVSHARGKWLCFVDSDDTLVNNALETLLSTADDFTDIIVAFSFEGNGNISRISIEDWRAKMFHGSDILCTRWGKLYRHSLFDDNSTYVPSKIRVGEDMIMNIKLAFRSERPVIILNQKVYCYNRNADSVSSTYSWTAEKYAQLFESLLEAIPDPFKKAISGPGLRYRQECIKNAFSMAKGLLTFDKIEKCKNLSSSRLISLIKNEVNSTPYKMTGEEFLIFQFSSSILTHYYFVLKHFLLIAIQSSRRRIKEFVK